MTPKERCADNILSGIDAIAFILPAAASYPSASKSLADAGLSLIMLAPGKSKMRRPADDHTLMNGPELPSAKARFMIDQRRVFAILEHITRLPNRHGSALCVRCFC